MDSLATRIVHRKASPPGSSREVPVEKIPPNPTPVPSRLRPEPIDEKFVPFEIVARIASLQHDRVKPQGNGRHRESTSRTGFDFEWVRS